MTSLIWRRRARRIVQGCAFAAAVLGLHACGGGSDGAAPPVSAAVSEADSAAAGQADLRLTYRVTTDEVVLSFLNPFTQASGLRIERQVAGVWTTAATLPASSASATTAGSWSDAAPSAKAYRVVALLPGREAVLRSAAGASQAEPRSDLRTAGITLHGHDDGTPLADTATISVWADVALPPQGYRWMVQRASGASLGEIACNEWNCSLDAYALSGGDYRLTARFDVGPGNAIEVSRSFQVDPNHFALWLGMDQGATTRVDVRASSDAGVVQVRFLLDGRLYAALSQPTWCATEPCKPGRDSSYAVDLPHAEIPKGTHTMKVEATDASGRMRSTEHRFELSDAPAAVLESPLPGALVRGSLRIRGAASDDRGVRESIVRLDSQVIRRGQGGSFDLQHDISQLSVGEHTLELYVGDNEGRYQLVRRRIIVTPADAPAFERIGTVGVYGVGGGELVAASGGRVLVREGSFSRYRVFGPIADAPPMKIDHPTAIQQFTFAGDWLLSNAPLSANQPYRTLAWAPDGRSSDLTPLSGVAPQSYSRFASSGPWAAWIYGENFAGYVIRQLDTGEQHVVVPPHPLAEGGIWGALLVHEAGGARLFFETRKGSFVYETRTRTLAPVDLPPGWRGISDGTRILWSAPGAGKLRAVPVNAAPADFAAPVILGDQVESTKLAGDGVVAWVEGTSGGINLGLKVNDGQGTVTLGGGSIVSVAGGGVLYRSDDRLLLWTRKDGSRVIHHEASSPALLGRGWVYLLPSPRYNETGLYRMPF